MYNSVQTPFAAIKKKKKKKTFESDSRKERLLLLSQGDTVCVMNWKCYQRRTDSCYDRPSKCWFHWYAVNYTFTLSHNEKKSHVVSTKGACIFAYNKTSNDKCQQHHTLMPW